MKSIMVFLIAPVALGALALIHGSNRTPSLATTSTAATETAIPQQQTGIIDGAVHPELIPDRVAYSLVFRLIANRRTAEEKSRIRAYIRHIGFADADVDGLIAAADEFHQNVSPLDAEARQIKINNRGNASPEVKAHLRELQSRKRRLLTT